MGCSSCGKSNAARAGNTANTAIIFGDVDSEVRRVRFAEDVSGVMQGAIKYVRGTGVEELVETGKLIPLAGGVRTVAPFRRGTSIYYVDGVGYTDMSTARVRSGQTGSEIVVKTIGE